jgi:hypothetical protein
MKKEYHLVAKRGSMRDSSCLNDSMHDSSFEANLRTVMEPTVFKKPRKLSPRSTQKKIESELVIDFNESSNEKETNIDSDQSGPKHNYSNSKIALGKDLSDKPTFFFGE